MSLSEEHYTSPASCQGHFYEKDTAMSREGLYLAQGGDRRVMRVTLINVNEMSTAGKTMGSKKC